MKGYKVATVMAGVFLVVGIATLKDYGMNWDSGYRFMRGQAFAQVLLMGKRTYGLPERISPLLFRPGEYVTRYDFLAGEGDKKAVLPDEVRPLREFRGLGLESRRVSFYQDEAWNGMNLKASDDPGHPPLPEILGAMANQWFYQKLGVLGDIESYHLSPLVLAAVGVWVVTVFTWQITGSLVGGIGAGLALGLYPMYFAEAHFNFKDPTQAAMFAGVVWAVWRWTVTRRKRWWGVGTGFLALAVAIKWNVVFLPVTVGAWLLATKQTRKVVTMKVLMAGIISVVVALAFMVAIWPAAWQDPLRWIIQVTGYYRSIGWSRDHIQPEGWLLPGGWNLFPVAVLGVQMPEVIMVLAIGGAMSGWKRYRSVTTLILLWVLLPITRSALPGMKSYNGMRQIMEVVPGMAILAGIGASQIIQNAKLKMQSYSVKFKIFSFELLFLTFIFALLTIPIVRLHPNENVYYNRLVGGIQGAKEKNLIDLMVTYGNVYKQGIAWLNERAEENARLAVTDGFATAGSPLWLREDIIVSPDYFSGLTRQGEYIMMLYKPHDQAVFAQRYLERFLTSVYEVKVDGVGLLKIYRNSPEQVKLGMEGERMVTGAKMGRQEIDLGKVEKVNRLVVEGGGKCQRENDTAVVDELVGFGLQSGELRAKGKVYGLQERRVVGDRIEFWFPAEEARWIGIFPQSAMSCLWRGKVVGVGVVD